MKFLDFDFPKLKGFLEKHTEVLLLEVAVSLLIGVLFRPDAAIIGSDNQNFATILNSFGQDGVIALVSVAIIFAILKK